MIDHEVRTYPSSARLARKEQLAWKLAAVATDPVEVEDPGWTRRYHAPDPGNRSFGGRVEVSMAGGTVVTGEIAVADAHPAGAHPFTRGQYVAKFRTLAGGVIAAGAQNRFLEAVTRLPDLDAGELAALALPGLDQAAEPPETWGIL
jgi:2-methylcitrate dehydratase